MLWRLSFRMLLSLASPWKIAAAPSSSIPLLLRSSLTRTRQRSCANAFPSSFASARRRRGRLPRSIRQSLRALPAQLNPPKDTVLRTSTRTSSECPFLQMTYTGENPHADGSAAPGPCPASDRPATATPTSRPGTHDNTMAGRQMPRGLMSSMPGLYPSLCCHSTR